MLDTEKELAKQIIVEIIRQAGGVLDFKTRLFKAFYHAHVHFADNQPGYLSSWPIVRMPRGPGIDKFDVLIGELMAEGRVTTHQIEVGENQAFQFCLGDAPQRSSVLPDGADESIAFGVQQVAGKSAKQVSTESHQVSRAWRQATDGQELNVYLDVLGDDEYRRRAIRVSEIGRALDAAMA